MKTRLRGCPIVISDGLMLLVRLRDPVSGVEAFYPPGGGVEAGETPDVTAVREALEETGVRIVVDPASELVARYPFVWSGWDFDVTTHFYAAWLAPGEGRALSPVVDADYNLGAAWQPIADALALLAVHPPIAAATKKIVDRMSKPGD